MRRRVGLFLSCGLVLPLVVVANASAQGATLEINPKFGPPGTVVTASGGGYVVGTTANPQPNITGGVNIRLDFRTAEVLANTSVDTANRINVQFTIPPGTAAGEHLVMATQNSDQRPGGLGGQTVAGPGRAKFLVTSGARAGAGGSPGGLGNGFPTAGGALIVALILLAGGTLAVRGMRTTNRPLGS